MQILQGGERLILTLWVGALWTVGYIVTPTLFSMLDDRKLAGQLAGQLFYIVSLVGLVCAPLLLLQQFTLWKQAGLKQWRVWVLVLMLALVCVGLFFLQPMMQDLKAQGLAEGSAAAAKFGKLHGLSSVLYLITSIGGLALVVAGQFRKE